MPLNDRTPAPLGLAGATRQDQARLWDSLLCHTFNSLSSRHRLHWLQGDPKFPGPSLVLDGRRELEFSSQAAEGKGEAEPTRLSLATGSPLAAQQWGQEPCPSLIFLHGRPMVGPQPPTTPTPP